MRKILIIEDDNSVKSLIKEIFEENGYEVFLASEGAEGVLIARDVIPDIIICDIMMPGMNGYETKQTLNSNPKTSVIPFIFLTAKADMGDLRSGMELGADDYIVKPFRVNSLLKTVELRLNRIQEIKDSDKEKIESKRLQELNAHKDKFLSILAHDLKGPVWSFVGLTEIFAEDITSFSLSELSELAKGMNDSANNLYTLLSGLLDWAMMQRGGVTFNPKVIHLSDAVHKNIELLIKSAQQKGVDIVTEVETSQTLFADEVMLNSILRNLISNAIKFSRHGGNVIIRASEVENKKVEVSITDIGIGMSEAVRERLFKIEEKVGRKGTDGEESNGLGLLLCKEFVEKHGGQIRAESSDKIGSTFYFTLPLSEKDINSTHENVVLPESKVNNSPELFV